MHYGGVVPERQEARSWFSEELKTIFYVSRRATREEVGISR